MVEHLSKGRIIWVELECRVELDSYHLPRSSLALEFLLHIPGSWYDVQGMYKAVSPLTACTVPFFFPIVVHSRPSAPTIHLFPYSDSSIPCWWTVGNIPCWYIPEFLPINIVPPYASPTIVLVFPKLPRPWPELSELQAFFYPSVQGRRSLAPSSKIPVGRIVQTQPNALPWLLLRGTEWILRTVCFATIPFSSWESVSKEQILHQLSSPSAIGFT